MHRPFAVPGLESAGARAVRRGTLPSIQEFLDELPSIEDFVDRSQVVLPPIADFVADAHTDSAANASADTHSGDWFQQAQSDAEGWAMTGWQNFDWSGAAALGARTQEADEAGSAWNTLDWSAPLPHSEKARTAREEAPPSADEVASALDGIARRIRSGELSIDQVSATPPEAAMAAAIAAMLRMRD